MYAVVKEKPDKGIDVRKVDEPLLLGESDVKIKIDACGICGSDLATYNWRTHRAHLVSELPRIIGHEGVGIIIEVGRNVQALKVGQRVVTEPIIYCGSCRYCLSGKLNICPEVKILGSHWDGCMAEYACMPERICYPIPDDIQDEYAPFLEILGVGVHALERIGSVFGKNCAVVGPGAIGLSVLQVIIAAGASSVTVIGTSLDEDRLQKAKEMGATEIITLKDEIPDNLMGEIDLVFECAGKPLALYHSAQLVGVGGSICLLGSYDEPVPIAFNKMIRYKEAEIITSRARTSETWRKVIAMVSAGKLKLSQYDVDVMSLKDAAEGFRRADTGESFKVVFNCSEG